MPRSLKDFVNLRELARIDAFIEVDAPLSDFARVAALAVTDRETSQASIQVSLRVSQGRNVVMVAGSLDGSVGLTCQRCLERMEYSLSGPVQLALTDDDAEVEELPEDCELVNLLDAMELGRGLDEVCLLPLVEDELLLRIPLVPMHDTGAFCDGRDRVGEIAATAASGESITRPFSALADLMADKGKRH